MVSQTFLTRESRTTEIVRSDRRHETRKKSYAAENLTLYKLSIFINYFSLLDHFEGNHSYPRFLTHVTFSTFIQWLSKGLVLKGNMSQNMPEERDILKVKRKTQHNFQIHHPWL